MENHKPKSLKELKSLRIPIRNVNVEVRKKLTRLDKIAIWITNNVGSMGFFLIIFVWTAVWFGWNSLMPKDVRFDPYPAFVLWLFISNVVQIFLMPLIMIGQNLQSDHAEVRAEADFEVNTKAEVEIETILMHLENQNKMILEILEKLDKKYTES
jgi:uncharacterized membrane protein